MHLSRGAVFVLLFLYATFVYFQIWSHKPLFEESMLSDEDEQLAMNREATRQNAIEGSQNVLKQDKPP